MSKYTGIRTDFSNGQYLMESITEVTPNYRPQWRDEAVPLHGFQGDKRKERANIVIPRAQVGGASNDVGFVRGEDGKFTAVISQFDRHKHSDKWLAQVKEAYGVRVAMHEARLSGYTTNLVRSKQSGQRTRLVIET